MRFFHLSTLCFLALLLIASDNAIAKTYHRSCSAWYEIKVTSVDGGTPASPIRRTKKVGNFSGRGKCGPYFRINDCRRRARDFCHSCMKEHWQNQSSRPVDCTYYSGGVGVRDYSIVDLKNSLDTHACDRLENVRIMYDVYRVTSGDKGCGPNTAKTMRRKLGTLETRCR